MGVDGECDDRRMQDMLSLINCMQLQCTRFEKYRSTIKGFKRCRSLKVTVGVCRRDETKAREERSRKGSLFRPHPWIVSLYEYVLKYSYNSMRGTDKT